MLPLMLCPLLLAPLTLASPLPSHTHHPAPAPHTYEHTYHDDSAVLAARQAGTSAVGSILGYSLQVLAGHALVAIFGAYVAYTYTVPYVMPEARGLANGIEDQRWDTVESVLSALSLPPDSRGQECRSRLVCDAVAAAASVPYVASYVHLGQDTRVFKYVEAAERGLEGGDCSAYECAATATGLLGW